MRHALDMSRGLVLGAAMWLVRPVYVVIELVVAAATVGGHDLTDDTVSELGAVECLQTLCSPRHELMNSTFVGIGLLLAVGALLLVGRLGRTVTALLVMAGLSSVATGLAPIDGDVTLHAVAAAPLFVCQPLALLLLGRRLWRTHGRLAVALLLTGTVTAAAALAFVASEAGQGLFERLALWPVLIATAAVAVTILEPGRGRTATST